MCVRVPFFFTGLARLEPSITVCTVVRASVLLFFSHANYLYFFLIHQNGVVLIWGETAQHVELPSLTQNPRRSLPLSHRKPATASTGGTVIIRREVAPSTWESVAEEVVSGTAKRFLGISSWGICLMRFMVKYEAFLIADNSILPWFLFLQSITRWLCSFVHDCGCYCARLL